MVVQFCLCVVKMTAVIYLDCFSCLPMTKSEIQDSAVSEPVAGQDVASAGELADFTLPYFPMESIIQATRRKVESSPCNPNTSTRTGYVSSPPENACLVTFGNTANDPCAIPETSVFKHVDYTELTPGYAFSPDVPSPFLRFQASAPLTIEDNEDSAQFKQIAQAALNVAEMHDDKTTPGSIFGSNHSLENIVHRPISAISLGAAMTPVTSSGEPLQAPQSIVEMQGAQIIQRHHVICPFFFTHPSRNTFPFRHQPLYFEDPNLERCGISDGCLTEFTSIWRFGARVPLLPYLMASNSPHGCVRALPDCPTCWRFGPETYIPQPTAKTVAAQAAATAGLIFLIP